MMKGEGWGVKSWDGSDGVGSARRRHSREDLEIQYVQVHLSQTKGLKHLLSRGLQQLEECAHQESHS